MEVNPLTKAELKWSDYKKVPVVLLDGEQINDSSAIISRLEAELESAGKAGSSGRQDSSSGGSSSSSGGWFGFGKSATAATPAAAAAPAGAGREEEEKWRRWVDSWFVRVITVNIYRNARESFQTFDYITEHGNFSWVQREAGVFFSCILYPARCGGISWTRAAQAVCPLDARGHAACEVGGVSQRVVPSRRACFLLHSC